ncbi:hypothetical protein S40285_04703 [Stachybotrys chlorohalonatus IBT 40285]|uniref:ELYS-like domain-containing protein n=1 Tax=Stachybotrys chlorohalonatus (strain IBT 40285) TaxID=1283841 RepID=A0A084R332_STAC4|nr:hypothetical protein S40285_04703 [Stachybotrys chlorohalonata IBT 40285]
MASLEDYQAVFSPKLQWPYDRKAIQGIESHRTTYEGYLFVDRVLRALGILKGKTYPPKTDNALQQLHQQICEANMTMHHKLSIFYYVLLDFDAANPKHSPSPSESFASKYGMPQSYQTFMLGLWYMDKSEFDTALEYIAHPSLIPDFADEIILALTRYASDGEDYSLALSYFYTVQPILKSSIALESLFEAIATTSMSEALVYSRTHPEHTREMLFRQLIAFALRSQTNEEVQRRTSELVFSTLDSTEEAWLEDYLSTDNSHTSKKSKDTLLVRRIICDRFAETEKQKAGNHWADLLQGIKEGIHGQEE